VPIRRIAYFPSKSKVMSEFYNKSVFKNTSPSSAIKQVLLPRLQILMASYNSAKYIEEQLLSILVQQGVSFKIIISDDCSTDNTLEVIAKVRQNYPDAIELYTASVNLGILGNFNKLMHYARADYIMFADADDVWLSHKITHTLSKMKELEKQHGSSLPLLVYTDLAVVDRQLQTIDPSFWHYSHLKPRKHTTFNRQMRQNVITGCTMLINRSLLELSKPLPAGIIMHDWWIGLVALAFGKITFLEQSTLLYRQHGKNGVGAHQYSLSGYFKYLRNPPYKTNNTFTQIAVFFEKFHNKLSKEQSESINAYLKIAKSNICYRLYLITKYGFYKHGWLRNIKSIISP